MVFARFRVNPNIWSLLLKNISTLLLSRKKSHQLSCNKLRPGPSLCCDSAINHPHAPLPWADFISDSFFMCVSVYVRVCGLYRCVKLTFHQSPALGALQCFTRPCGSSMIRMTSAALNPRSAITSRRKAAEDFSYLWGLPLKENNWNCITVSATIWLLQRHFQQTISSLNLHAKVLLPFSAQCYFKVFIPDSRSRHCCAESDSGEKISSSAGNSIYCRWSTGKHTRPLDLNKHMVVHSEGDCLFNGQAHESHPPCTHRSLNVLEAGEGMWNRMCRDVAKITCQLRIHWVFSR